MMIELEMLSAAVRRQAYIGQARLTRSLTDTAASEDLACHFRVLCVYVCNCKFIASLAELAQQNCSLFFSNQFHLNFIQCMGDIWKILIYEAERRK